MAARLGLFFQGIEILILLAGDQSNWQSLCSRGDFSLDDGTCAWMPLVLVVLILIRLEVSEKIYLMPESLHDEPSFEM